MKGRPTAGPAIPAPAAAAPSSSESEPIGNMTLSGLIKTKNGFAVATAELTPGGTLLNLKIGRSQAYKEFLALEHKRLIAKLGGLL